MIEVTLASDVEGHDYLLDLDTGRVLTPAQEMRPERLVNPTLGFPTRESCERIWRAYLYGLGVDVINEEHLRGLADCDMVLDPAFLFRTREGNYGVLQITEIVRHPNRVKRVSLRFKLVEVSGQSAHRRTL